MQSADIYFNIVNIVALFFFSLEIVLSSIGKEDYFGKFFFWLDVISTASLIFDITWVWDPIQSSFSGGSAATDTSQIARAGRAGRAGSRAGRVIRIVRVVRLIRIAKLYKHAVETTERERHDTVLPGELLDTPDEEGPAHSPPDVEEEKEENAEEGMEPESRVGKKLSELTTRRVIILVLVMLLAIPLLDETQWVDNPPVGQYGILNIAEFAEAYGQATTSGVSSFQVDAAVYKQGYDFSILTFLQYHVQGNPQGLNNYLIYIRMPYSLSLSEDAIREYATRNNMITDAIVNLKSEDLLDPGVVVNPAGTVPGDLRTAEKSTVEFEVCEDFIPPTEQCSNSAQRPILAVFTLRYEVVMGAALNIAKTVFICLVLALGALFFSKDANELVLNPIERMIAKVEKIRQNPMVAAKLGEKEAEEAEKDPEEPKSGVARYSRAVTENITRYRFNKNKNNKKKKGPDPYETLILEKTIIKIGGLLALGFGEAGGEIIANNMKNSDGGLNAMVAGRKIQAIFGFCDIRQFTDATEVLRENVMMFVNQIAEIVHSIVDTFSGAANKNIGDAFLLVWRFPEKDRNMEVKEQTEDAAIKAKLADMSVMAFLKIMAAINRSSVLAQYRTNKALCNRIPNYKVKMGFGLHVGWAIEGAIGSKFKVDASYLSPNVNMASRFSVYSMFDSDPDLIEMREHVTEKFMSTFRKGYALYEAGEWQQARDVLEKAKKMLEEEDGPSCTLLDYMETFQFQAPGAWEGFRALTEK
uniref:Guanylate cyclase domain-containing protein n=1 Tax=Chromera velia CCMP2878 TaxID=1169474 RepID=A0A0G4FMQ5_9ALVE|eukprot:Cvel_3502.t1-p1 / transcript=Cvel_3502.t1 / gene=Cvel_3502 / organism=Chromera_velia_CCMP2878 / gene_product=Adenylate cyclase 2, putative / transcript_product=Adenylate cyclase 2, putative / location=Cvel_scaffold141:111225-119490(+) / protein_length=754 / sequence_SO=supercontig / SO=protein_coding / is_pseudo=false